MNIAMEQTEEYVNGQLKAKYGDTFIRGNNGERHLHTPFHAPNPSITGPPGRLSAQFFTSVRRGRGDVPEVRSHVTFGLACWCPPDCSHAGRGVSFCSLSATFEVRIPAHALSVYYPLPAGSVGVVAHPGEPTAGSRSCSVA